MSISHRQASIRIDQDALDLHRVRDFPAALLGMAGHDLRQPLQIIQSAYEWLGRHVAHTSEQARLERGERAIAKLAEQLDRLVGALHLYEHSQNVEIADIALIPLFRRIASENEKDAQEKGIDIRVHATRVKIMSSPILLEGILRNLVRNAVKYTESGGSILIGCRSIGEDTRIDVCDTGVGIPPQHLTRIFDAFQRVDSTHPDGLGIGLFVVRRAAGLLGHRIEVRSQAGRGSRFSVFVPKAS